MTTDQPANSKSKRLWHQYSLRTLLVFVTLFAFACSWLGVKLQQAKRQKEVVEAILKAGGIVSYDYQFDASGNDIQGAVPPGPAWLRKLLGDDLFTSATEVSFGNKNVSNNDLAHLKDLPKLETLAISLIPNNNISLQPIKRLTRLKYLTLAYMQIDDAQLENLKGLIRLQSLNLLNTSITDAALENFKELIQLDSLNLSGTKITDAGLENLKRLTQLVNLDLSNTNIADAGLAHIRGLSRIQLLRLPGTQITDAGLEHLKGLTQLAYLFLAPKQAKAVGVLEADLLDEWEHSASGAATGQS